MGYKGISGFWNEFGTIRPKKIGYWCNVLKNLGR